MTDEGIRSTQEEKEELRRLREEKNKRKQAEQGGEPTESDKKPEPGPTSLNPAHGLPSVDDKPPEPGPDDAPRVRPSC